MGEPALTLPDLKYYSILSTSFYNKFAEHVKQFDSIYFFSLSEIRCIDQISEAFRRSENISKCKIKERGAYFLCLLSGTPRIDLAMQKSGLQKETTKFGAVSAYPLKIENFENSFKGLITPINVNLNERCTEAHMKIFTYMTMVDFHLHS